MPALAEHGDPISVAVVHDYLNQCGGAEAVALELARIWPGSPIYTSLYRPSSTFAGFAAEDVRVSPLNRIPVDAGFRALAPLYPLAFRAFGELTQDVVISSSSGWAHGIRTSPSTVHIVYCHTPARWLYRADDHLGQALGPQLLAPLTRPLRHWDQAAARRADLYVANSQYVKRRISAVYGRESEVLHPPVDTERFTPTERGERVLVISRLLPYKRIDLAVRAATQAGFGLDVVGSGPLLDELRAIAGPTVTFHGRVDEQMLVRLLEACRLLCVSATEDFGITPVEANAAGKPVVAYAAGGALETVTEGLNGTFFHEQTVEALLKAIDRADALATSPAEFASVAGQFSVAAFRERFVSLVEEASARRRSQMPDERPSNRSSVA